MTSKTNPILVVDDDRASRRLLTRTLTAAGYACAEAESGEEALAFVRKEAPCLLLLDYDMPGLDGADVSKQIRADPSPAIAQIPTIMLTGHGSEESEVLCLQAGADDFVTKPIHPEVLRARIETQLRLRSMRDQLVKQNEELEAWRGNLEQDLEAARRTQRSLIPAKPPELRGWEIAAFYRPVIQVGGDIYGWLRMRDGRMLFWIADATGHGAAAALLTTLAKLLFHHANAENDTPAGIMQAVDRDFRSILGARSFMTAMCVALDLEKGGGSIVGAGHPPLVIARGDGATESIASTSPPLGLVADARFSETPMELRGGDLFLLYTDGLYGVGEADDRREAPAQIAQQLLSASNGTQSVLQDFFHQTERAGSDAIPPDDIAALAVRRLEGRN